MENSQNEALQPVPNNQDSNDWFLKILISMVNRTENDLTFGITLVTHGFVVSGMLVGTEEYFKGIGDTFGKKLDEAFNSSASTFNKMFSEMGAQVKPTTESSENIAYIHLKGARIHSTIGNSIPDNGGVWWRGRLSEVSGFSLGELMGAG